MSIERALRLVAVLACLSLIPEFASAQSNATIAGVAKDSSGAILPGVTVEAASPSLIEKTRTAVTDGAGQYKIVNLVPGVYSVTFSLTGFNTVKREGIELTGAFTASVNADMKVGIARRDHHRVGPGVGRGRAERHAAEGRHARRAQRHPGRHEVHGPDRRPHPRRDEHQPGRRRHGVLRCRPRGPRQPPERAGGALRRHELQQRPGPRRPVHRDRHQRCDRAGNGDRDGRPVGGKRNQRRPHQPRAERRREQLPRRVHHLLQRSQPPERQSQRRPESPRADVDDDGEQVVRRESRVRRADQEGHALVLRLGARAGFRADARGHLLQPDTHGPRLHARPHEAGRQHRAEPEREPPPDVADLAAQQAEPAAPERQPAAAVLRVCARPAHERARGDLLLEVGADVPVAGQLQLAGHRQVPDRSRRALQQQGLPDEAAADQRARPDRVLGFGHGLQLGQLRQHVRPQREPQLQHALRRLVRHRLARDQDRRHVHAPLGLDIVGRREQRDDAAAVERLCRAR